jgi:hypothetical protein
MTGCDPRTYYKPPPWRARLIAPTALAAVPTHWAARLDGELMTPRAYSLLNAG